MNERSTVHTASPTSGLMLMLGSTACFTGNVLLIRALGQVQAVDVWTLALARFGVGLAVVIGLYGRRVEFGRLFQNPMLASRGIVGGLGTCAFYLTIEHLGAGRATFISNTYVIFAGLLAIPMLGERFRLTLATGSGVALAGLALLTGAFDPQRSLGPYEAIAMSGALGAAYVVVTIRRLHATDHTATIFAAQCVYGMLICVIPAVLHAPVLSTGTGLLMVAGGLAASAGQILMTRAYREVSVAQGTILQMLVPLGVALGGICFFGERFRFTEMLGSGLIVLGTVHASLRR